MDITFLKMNDDYVCSSKANDNLDFEDLCGKLTAYHLKELLLKTVPRLDEKKEEIEVSSEWSYNGYKVFIFGDKLSDSEVNTFVAAMDPIKQIGICDLFWNKFSEQREYTGMLLTYDMRHYYKVFSGTHTFLIMAYHGLQDFLDKLGLSYDFLPIEYEKMIKKFNFIYDRDVEKEITKQKIKGTYVAPKVEMAKGKGGRGRIRSSDSDSRFNTYWDNQFKK